MTQPNKYRRIKWLHAPVKECDKRWVTADFCDGHGEMIMRFSRTSDPEFSGEQWVVITHARAVFLGPELDVQMAQRLAVVIRGMLT